MDFLQYIELSAENLQFFLWHKDYIRRFAELPESEKGLSPEWTKEKAQAEMSAAKKEKKQSRLPVEVTSVLKGTDFESKPRVVAVESPNPFHTPPRTPRGDRDSMTPSTVGWSDNGSTMYSGTTSYQKKSAAAFEEAEAFLPFTVQPFREEVSRIIAIYIADDGVRQLNLSAKERATLLKALSMTTHPSTFHDIATTVEWTLRHQAHPNFIRWTICNGNPPRQHFARGLGITTITMGLAYATVITLSSANRGWRALAALPWIVGIATLFAGWKGMCVVLHGMHHRHLRPWEMFATEDSGCNNFDLKKGSFDSFGSKNSYEDEPWIAKYEKRNIMRKIFDREVWIQEPALRQIQDTIFLQAIGTAVIISAVLVAVFVAVPAGNCF